MIDDTLYDAFGQRQISIMFTQLNQYRVVLESQARACSDGPDDARATFTSVRPAGRRSAAERLHALRQATSPLAVNHQGQFPVVTVFVQSGAGRIAGRRGRRRSITRKEELDMPASIQASFQGTAAAFRIRWPTSRF